MPLLPRSGPRPGCLDYDPTLASALEEATGSVHRLAGMVGLLPNAHRLVTAAVQAAAVAGRALEDERVDVLDLLRLEAGDTNRMDAHRRAAAERAADGVAALEGGLELLSAGAPLDGRLLAAVRDRMAGVGEGPLGARCLWTRGRSPAAVGAMAPRFARALRDLFDPTGPVLVHLALAHWRLGAPSRRGAADRRLGPLLVPLRLAQAGVLVQPVLRLSVHFARHLDEYRALLAGEDPEPWVRWFLDAVRVQASADTRWAIRLLQVQLATAHRLRQRRASATAVSAAGTLLARPFLTANTLAADLGVTLPTARSAIAQLVESGEVVETTLRRRSRCYLAAGMLAEVHGHQSLGGDSNP